jgi:hypothetical protein
VACRGHGQAPLFRGRVRAPSRVSSPGSNLLYPPAGHSSQQHRLPSSGGYNPTWISPDKVAVRRWVVVRLGFKSLHPSHLGSDVHGRTELSAVRVVAGTVSAELVCRPRYLGAESTQLFGDHRVNQAALRVEGLP